MIHVYAGGPIDFWNGWQKTNEVVTYERTELRVPPGLKIDRDEYLPFLFAVKELAHDLGWEGDMREGPFVSVLPDPQTGGALLLTAFKQDNNGITFVGSQVELDYLAAAGWTHKTGEMPKAADPRVLGAA